MLDAGFLRSSYYDCVTNFGNPAMTRRLGDRRIGYFCRESPHMLEAVGFVTQSYYERQVENLALADRQQLRGFATATECKDPTRREWPSRAAVPKSARHPRPRRRGSSPRPGTGG